MSWTGRRTELFGREPSADEAIVWRDVESHELDRLEPVFAPPAPEPEIAPAPQPEPEPEPEPDFDAAIPTPRMQAEPQAAPDVIEVSPEIIEAAPEAIEVAPQVIAAAPPPSAKAPPVIEDVEDGTAPRSQRLWLPRAGHRPGARRRPVRLLQSRDLNHVAGQ